MKKIFALAVIMTLAVVSTQAQDIVRGIRNSGILVKGSRGLPSVKFKEGMMVSLANKEEGMAFEMTKNGKVIPLFDPVDAKIGQVVEADVDGDGKMEILAGYRKTDNDFTLNIFRKAEFEFDYVLWATVNGNAYAEIPQNGTVKLYTKEGSVSVMKFDSEGKLTPVTAK